MFPHFPYFNLGVSIHAPAWGATKRGCRQALPGLFQSTRPRGARPSDRDHTAASRGFQSTRPRGARPSCVFVPHCQGRFNPRARVGRDARYNIQQGKKYSFNPRARVGRDKGKFGRGDSEVTVSIHAPAWGATYGVSAQQIMPLMFQSTRPRGARPRSWTGRTALSCFNPRARVGRDPTESLQTN